MRIPGLRFVKENWFGRIPDIDVKMRANDTTSNSLQLSLQSADANRFHDGIDAKATRFRLNTGRNSSRGITVLAGTAAVTAFYYIFFSNQSRQNMPGPICPGRPATPLETDAVHAALHKFMSHVPIQRICPLHPMQPGTNRFRVDTPNIELTLKILDASENFATQSSFVPLCRNTQVWAEKKLAAPVQYCNAKLGVLLSEYLPNDRQLLANTDPELLWDMQISMFSAIHSATHPPLLDLHSFGLERYLEFSKKLNRIESFSRNDMRVSDDTSRRLEKVGAVAKKLYTPQEKMDYTQTLCLGNVEPTNMIFNRAFNPDMAIPDDWGAMRYCDPMEELGDFLFDSSADIADVSHLLSNYTLYDRQLGRRDLTRAQHHFGYKCVMEFLAELANTPSNELARLQHQLRLDAIYGKIVQIEALLFGQSQRHTAAEWLSA